MTGDHTPGKWQVLSIQTKSLCSTDPWLPEALTTWSTTSHSLRWEVRHILLRWGFNSSIYWERPVSLSSGFLGPFHQFLSGPLRSIPEDGRRRVAGAPGAPPTWSGSGWVTAGKEQSLFGGRPLPASGSCISERWRSPSAPSGRSGTTTDGDWKSWVSAGHAARAGGEGGCAPAAGTGSLQPSARVVVRLVCAPGCTRGSQAIQSPPPNRRVEIRRSLRWFGWRIGIWN